MALTFDRGRVFTSPEAQARVEADERADAEAPLRALLDILEHPGEHPAGAPGSALRRAWHLGRELRALRGR